MATYKIKLLTLLLLTVALTGNAATVFPGTEWDSIATTSATCKQQQAELDGYVQKQATTALLAIKNGRILY
ncbi:MAG: hypothetical protein HYR68_00030, partial [Burkholderiales bacterium]|nr:hypothetical protein [Burkholderiales bacterium]